MTSLEVARKAGAMRSARLPSARSAFDWLLRIVAVVLLALMLATAAHNVSVSYDVWWYHMPFASRLAGIVGENSFLLSPLNTERFKGFPLLAEFLQGILWRLSGRPESANLLAFSSVPIFAWFFRRQFGVPFHISALALLAIPIVHTHAVDAHVDLPASAATAALVLLTMQAFASVKPPSIKLLMLAAVSATFAMNSKLVVGPIIAASIALLGLRTLFLLRRVPDSAKRRYRRVVLGFALLVPIVFMTPLKNAVLYGNPVYPMQFEIFGHQLPGSEEEYISAPDWLKDSSRPVQFAASVLEMGARSFEDPKRWTVGQSTPLNHPGLRMGGFFNAYVAFHVLLLGWHSLRERTRQSRVAAAGFGLVTLITAPLPQSLEARYFMYWMILLVAINLWLSFRSGAPAWQSVIVGAGAVAALGVVLWSTRAVYAMPTGRTFSQLLSAQVNPRSIARIRDGQTVCVAREPFNILFAAHFHPPRDYAIQAANIPSECKGLRLIEGPPRRRRRR